MYKSEELLPREAVPGLVKTQNNCGYMALKLDRFSKAFVDEVNPSSIVLEIGAAYGYATMDALKNGATVYANDLSESHIEILKKRGAIYANRLKTFACPIQELDFKPSTFNAILACRVFHFLTGEEVEMMFKKMFGWLHSGGRLYLVLDTPYFGVWGRNFSSEYEQRVATHQPWPSVMNPFEKYLPATADRSVAPSFLNPFDLWQGVELCKMAGFVVELESYIDRKGDFPLEFCFDGRESAGIIARKP